MEVDTTQFNDIYKEMAELLGDAAALKMWNRYAGVSVSFPKQCIPGSTYGSLFTTTAM